MKPDDTAQDAALHEVARRLGHQAADRLDVEATARTVVERLREQPAQRTIWIKPAWLRIAAALVILVGGAVVLRPGSDSNHVAHLVADDLSELSTDQLKDVLTGLDELIVQGTAPDESADLDELDPQQLRTVLRTLEG